MKPGVVIAGRYTIDELAGTGGMSAVYRAHDSDGRPVALKVVRARTLLLERRFHREIELLRTLGHPAIVGYLDSGLIGADERFLVMEWLEGIDLKEQLSRSRLTVGQALQVIARVADGLAMAHARGVVHRDVKPGNIFLPGGALAEAKLIDFGLARWTDATQALTAAGSRFGTPAYMSPEQVRAQPDIDARTDVFALGCVLFECLTGEPAFVAHDLMAVFCKILMSESPALSTLCSEVPGSVERLVHDMMAKNPAERPDHGAAVGERVRAIASELDPHELDVVVESHSAAAITESEQRWVNVVMTHLDPAAVAPDSAADEVGSPVITGGETQMHIPDLAAQGIALESLAGELEALGARCSSLGAGGLIAALESAEMVGLGTAMDQTGNAARCALRVRRRFPGASVGVASGRAAVGQERTLDDVIDRAASLLDGSGTRARGAGAGESPGRAGIWVDEATFNLIHNRFDFVAPAPGRPERPPQRLTSPSQETDFRPGWTPARELLRERPFDVPQGLLGRETPFVGRRRELAMLIGTVEECLDERVGRLVLISGPPGSGKSRLRHEFLRALEGFDDIACWLAHGDPMRAGSPLALFSEAIRRACGLDELSDGRKEASRRPDERVGRPHEDGRHGKLESWVTSLGGGSLRGDDAARVSRFLGELLKVPSPSDDVQLRAARLDPLLMGDQTRRACLDLLHAETTTSPLVLILEDLHWGDNASIDLLDVALRSLVERPLAVVAFARPEVQELFPAIWTAHNCTVVHLGKLSRRACHKLARSILGDEVPEERLAALVEQSDGNAFYLEELLRSAVAGDWSLPETLLAMVDTRLGSLDAEARQVLRAASIYGQRFWLRGAHALLDEEIPAGYWLDYLVDSEILDVADQSRLPGEMEYVFRHSLVREGAYAMLTEDDCKLGHRLAGRWLREVGESDDRVVAEHFERGEAPGEAIPHFLAAARDALDHSDFATAVELAERGLACGASGPLKGAFLRVITEERIWQGKTRDVAELCSEAMSLVPRGSPEWYDVVGEAAMVAGRLGQAARIDELRADLGPAPEDTDARIGWQLAAAKLAAQLFMVGATGRGEALLDDLARRVGDLSEADPLVAAHVHFARARTPTALEDPSFMLIELERCAAAFTAIGDLRQASLQRSNVGYAKMELGLFEQCESDVERAMADAGQLSLDIVTYAAMQSLALVHGHRGEYGRSIAGLRAAGAWFREHDDERLATWAALDLAAVYLAAGRIENAESETRAALEGIPEALRPRALATLAEIHLARGESGAAAHVAREAHDALCALGAVETGESLVRLVVARALDAVGDREGALVAIDEARAALMARAHEIGRPEWRDSFLHNIPEHARTLELARHWNEPTHRPASGSGNGRE